MFNRAHKLKGKIWNGVWSQHRNIKIMKSLKKRQKKINIYIKSNLHRINIKESSCSTNNKIINLTLTHLLNRSQFSNIKTIYLAAINSKNWFLLLISTGKTWIHSNLFENFSLSESVRCRWNFHQTSQLFQNIGHSNWTDSIDFIVINILFLTHFSNQLSLNNKFYYLISYSTKKVWPRLLDLSYFIP